MEINRQHHHLDPRLQQKNQPHLNKFQDPITLYQKPVTFNDKKKFEDEQALTKEG